MLLSETEYHTNFILKKWSDFIVLYEKYKIMFYTCLSQIKQGNVTLLQQKLS